MPRVTRRSVASKEPSESQKSTSSRKRGAKKEEAEEVAPEEPISTPSKRSGRQAARGESKSEEAAKGRASARGRSKPRGGRGKKEEPENEEEEAEESEDDEEEDTVKESSQNKGKGGRGGKSRGARGKTGRGGKAAEEEDEEKSMEAEGSVEKEDADEETPTTAKGRGSRGKGKSSSVTPSPQGGRRSKSTTPGTDEKQEKTENEEDVEESENTEKAVEATPRGRQRKTQNKETPPPSSQRRGKGQKSETPPTPARSSRKTGGSSTSIEQEQLNETADAEPMETEEGIASPKADTESVESSAAQVVIKEPAAESSPSKKRKLEDDTDEHKVKRMRTNLSKAEDVDGDDDFVVIDKNDVPGPDSQEVVDSLPPVLSEKSMPTTPDDVGGEGPRISPLMSTPGVPFVVPLTEAELAKQYTAQQSDRDETSSTLVEVGSECASDITGLSSRAFDISDAVSLDSMDTTTGESAVDSTRDPISPTCMQPISVPNAASQQLNTDSAVDHTCLQNNPSNAAIESSQETTVNKQFSSAPADDTNAVISLPDQQQSGTFEPCGGESGTSENANNNVEALSSQTISHNCTVDDPADTNPASEKAAPETYVPSSVAIDSRKFILNPNFPAEMMDPAFCFSVVSYNILADCHMRRSDYSYTEPQFLEQEYRHTLLLKELDFLEGDIVCMQEVNPSYYMQTLLPAMKSRGYDGHFVKRTKEYYDEGEATFVRTARFDIISYQSLMLGELAHKEVDDSGLNEEVSQAAKKYLDRADVILLTELRCKKTGKVITVCNIHVVYDLKAPDVQCIQVACAIKQLVVKAGNDLSPHIICGDFNSDLISPGYQLAKDGYLSDDHIHKLQALKNLDNTDGSSQCLINHMWRAFQHTSSNLKSSYELTLGKEPPVTSFTKNTHKTLDYIFHSAASIDTVGVLETLDLQVVDATGGLPSTHIPSDHLSLKALYRLK